jgi:hypothetical protein
MVAIRRADSLGGVVFRGVTPARGYRIDEPRAVSTGVTVFGDRRAPPSTRLYD